MDEQALVIAGNKRIAGSLAGMDLTRIPMLDSALQSPQEREAASTIPVYGQFPFVPNHADEAASNPLVSGNDQSLYRSLTEHRD